MKSRFWKGFTKYHLVSSWATLRFFCGTMFRRKNQRQLSECQRWMNNSMNLHLTINKLAKLKRHASYVHYASNIFGGPIHFVLENFRLYTLGFEHVGRHVQLHVGHFFVGHHVGHPIHLHVAQSFFQPPCQPPCPLPCWSPCRPPQCRLDALWGLRNGFT